MLYDDTMGLSEYSLRQRAEEIAQERECSVDTLSEANMRALCHELEVHQVELEMQNEYLQRAQAELAASENKYKDLYEYAPIGYLTLDVSGKALEANLTSASFLGTTRTYLVNNRFQAYLATKCIPKFNAFCKRVMESNVKQDAEFQLMNGNSSKNESPRWVLIEARAIRDGNSTGFRMAVIDVTERKRMEVEILKRSTELAAATKAAESSTRTKAVFLANMSHEIRTPMNAIIGMTELLMEDPLTAEQRENLEIIRVNGDALLTIINDILDFSKIEGNKVILDEYQFNLRQSVEEALDLVAIKAVEKGLNLAYTIDKEVPDTIIGDPGRLRQVLGNLLSNAVKFTNKGEVVLSVSSQPIDQINQINEIHFAVQDTGIGISQDNMSQLFQSFSQIGKSTTSIYGGTGLGLAISRKLVGLMGGTIWAESEADKGSTFHFTIKAFSGQFEPLPAIVSRQMIGKKVLIIVDNKTNRRILFNQVHDWGMIPKAAPSLEEALDWIRSGNDFNVAILDTDLQGMNRLNLERKISQYNTALPLVLLTSLGKHMPSDHACLTRPIKPFQLYKVLMDILSRQPLPQLVKAHVAGLPGPNGHLRILLVEDNLSNQKVAVQILKKLGYDADIAANGIEALQSLERQHYDIVLMDVRMPLMDGLEATRIIRQRWPNNGPKIVALTALALEDDRKRCLEAGMNGYITKPIRKGDLAQALKHIQRL